MFFKYIDPCTLNPCGPNAQCSPSERESDGRVCKCDPGYLGNPYVFCARGECLTDNDCSANYICNNNYLCFDPCIGACAPQAICDVGVGGVSCKCPRGTTGNPFESCEPYRIFRYKKSVNETDIDKSLEKKKTLKFV